MKNGSPFIVYPSSFTLHFLPFVFFALDRHHGKAGKKCGVKYEEQRVCSSAYSSFFTFHFLPFALPSPL
jgi:hypothetical protein